MSDEKVQSLQHFWQYLDELSKTDPDGYKRYIAEQRREYEAESKKQGAFLPKPKITYAASVVSASSGPQPADAISTGPRVPATSNATRKLRNAATAAESLAVDVSLSLLYWSLCSHEEVGPAQLKRAPAGTIAPPDAPVSQLLIPLSVGPSVALPALAIPAQPKIALADTGADVAAALAGPAFQNSFTTPWDGAIAAHPAVVAEQDADVKALIVRACRVALSAAAAAGAGARRPHASVGAAPPPRSASSSAAAAAAAATADVVGAGGEGGAGLPISLGTLSVQRHAVDVVFSPPIIARAEKDIELWLALQTLAMSHLEEDHCLKLDRPYATLKAPIPLPGRPIHLSADLLDKRKQQGLAAQRAGLAAGAGSAPAKAGGGAGSGVVLTGKTLTPGEDALLAGAAAAGGSLGIDLTSLRIGPSAGAGAAGTATSSSGARGPLVMEMGDVAASSADGAAGGVTAPAAAAARAKPLIVELKQTPEFRVSSKDGVITVTVSLPLESSMAGIDVDVSDTHWSLASANYEARSAFPVPVLSAEAAAKFSKKKNQLVISVARRPA